MAEMTVSFLHEWILAFFFQILNLKDLFFYSIEL